VAGETFLFEQGKDERGKDGFAVDGTDVHPQAKNSDKDKERSEHGEYLVSTQLFRPCPGYHSVRPFAMLFGQWKA